MFLLVVLMCAVPAEDNLVTSIGQLKDERAAVRLKAVKALQEMGAKAASALPALLEAYGAEKEAHGKLVILQALRDIQRAAARSPLEKSMAHLFDVITETTRIQLSGLDCVGGFDKIQEYQQTIRELKDAVLAHQEQHNRRLKAYDKLLHERDQEIIDLKKQVAELERRLKGR